jgi:hypothetical protein
VRDERQRSLAREPEGDVEARATWFRRRVQEGELHAARIQLLAFTGDPAAGLACDQPAGPDPGLDPAQFFVALIEHDSEAACRLALHCAGPLVEALARLAEWESRPQEALEAAWAWLETEDLALRETARVAASQAVEDAEDAGDELMDRQLEGLSIDLALLAWGIVAAARLGTELREESLPTLGREVFNELEAGFAELGTLEPLDGASCLEAGLRKLRGWCLMTR